MSEPQSGSAAYGLPLSDWSRTVLDSAMDAIVMIDHLGRIAFWNPAAAAMFGRSLPEVIGQDMADLIIPVELRDRHRNALRDSRLSQPGSILGRRFEVRGQRPDGSSFPVELTITRTDVDGRRLYTGYLRDITQRQHLLAELRDSQARLVEVSDQTRRSIERNLHDGAQQHLVGAAMVVSQARSSLTARPTQAEALLAQAQEVLVEAITEIRELAMGILPSSLIEHGLEPALAELVRRSPVPVDAAVEAGRWPSTVETTVYFLTAEALTNAAKHGAQHARLDVCTDNLPASDLTNASTGLRACLVCQITDDGPGGADLGRGSGLLGLQDRVSAVGGVLQIISPPGRGTRLIATIPIA